MTSFSIRFAGDADLVRWDSIVDASPMGTPFHRLAWLRAAEAESRCGLLLLVCEKEGEGTVCQLPLFSQRKGPLRVLLSPPPSCAIPYLGPVFLHQSDKQYRIEADRIAVVEAILRFLHDSSPHHYLRIVAPPELQDVRPFIWSGFSASPAYTYRLPLRSDHASLFEGFDKRVRKRTKQAEEQTSWNVRKDQREDYGRVLEHVRRRYGEQERQFAPSNRYFQALVEQFGGTLLRARGIISGTQWVSGIIYVRHNGNIKAWLGGVKPQEAFAGANERLHWGMIRESIAGGLAYYERIGANTPRLCMNKAKYNLKPVPYFVLERGTPVGRIAAAIYKRIKSGRRADLEE